MKQIKNGSTLFLIVEVFQNFKAHSPLGKIKQCQHFVGIGIFLSKSSSGKSDRNMKKLHFARVMWNVQKIQVFCKLKNFSMKCLSYVSIEPSILKPHRVCSFQKSTLFNIEEASPQLISNILENHPSPPAQEKEQV